LAITGEASYGETSIEKMAIPSMALLQLKLANHRSNRSNYLTALRLIEIYFKPHESYASEYSSRAVRERAT